MTWATAGLAFSRATSPAETVAASELIVWNCLTWRGVHLAELGHHRLLVGPDGLAARLAAAELPTCCCASWLL